MATWFSSIQRGMARFVAGVERMLTPGVVALGVAAGTGYVAAEDYPSRAAMGAMARHVWVRVPVNAVAGDIAALPLVAKYKRSAGKRDELVDSRAIDLLERPNPHYSGTLFRKQVLVDYLLCGDAFIEIGQASLWRLHPAEVDIELDPYGLPAFYKVRDSSKANGYRRLLPSQVLHIRDASWASDSRAAYGASAIRALHDDLSIELQTKKLAKANATQGLPRMLLSTKQSLGPAQAEKLSDTYADAIARNAGVVAVGGDVTAQPLNYTPRELEWKEQSARTQEAALALFEVPPARAMLTTANYGTQKQQMRSYWESLIRRSRFFDDAFSRLAEPGVYISHDFSDVEALQVGYTERLMRVTTWVGMGASPAAAAAYELFDAPPVGDQPLVDSFHSPRRPAREPDEPEKSGASEVLTVLGGGRHLPEAAMATILGGYLQQAAARWEEVAVAARSGADLQLMASIESGRLYGTLMGLGIPEAVARWHADDETRDTLDIVDSLARIAGDDEPLGLAGFEGFGQRRAQRMAAHLARELAQEAA